MCISKIKKWEILLTFLTGVKTSYTIYELPRVTRQLLWFYMQYKPNFVIFSWIFHFSGILPCKKIVEFWCLLWCKFKIFFLILVNVFVFINVFKSLLTYFTNMFDKNFVQIKILNSVTRKLPTRIFFRSTNQIVNFTLRSYGIVNCTTLLEVAG